jgi:hypothetical protein
MLVVVTTKLVGAERLAVPVESIVGKHRLVENFAVQ